MKMLSALTLMASAALGAMAQAPNYNLSKPITTKNIGRNYMRGAYSKYRPHQGKQEIERRLRNAAQARQRYLFAAMQANNDNRLRAVAA